MKAEEREKNRLDFATDQLIEAIAAPIKGALAQSRENVRRQARREALEEAAQKLDAVGNGAMAREIRALMEKQE